MRKTVNILTQIQSGSDNPLFFIEECDFGVICKSSNCESVYWYDNRGSVGKFYNYFGLEKNIAILKEKKLNEILLNLTIDNARKIKEEIRDLLAFLDFGNYSVSYIESNNEQNKNGYNYYNIVFPKFDNSKFTEEELAEDFKFFFIKSVKERGNYIPPDIVDHSARSFYDAYESHIIATKHKSDLDNLRISFYREQIRSGKRPPIILLTCTSNHSILNSFIIDGHHKAVAYLQEEINPALINITGVASYSEDTINKLKQVSKMLYREQFEYLILSNYASHQLNEEICSDRYLTTYCQNGLVIKKYPNGIIRQKGNYSNNKKNGIIEWFYPDGSIEKREKYEEGRYICTYERYFHDGKLLQKGNENGIIECYDIYGNRIQ